MGNLQYISTSRDFVKAKHALEYAWQRLVRSCTVQPPQPRRPVGAPAAFRAPANQPLNPHYDLNDSSRTMAFDPMTGKMRPAVRDLRFKGLKVSTGANGIPDIWDAAARSVYENARKHYLEARAKYFKKDTKNIRARMQAQTQHMANLQLLGVQDTNLEGLQSLANELCIDAVREYTNRPGKDQSKALLSAVAEAQLVGADDFPGVQAAQNLMNEVFSGN
jgi:hypothetical protein